MLITITKSSKQAIQLDKNYVFVNLFRGDDFSTHIFAGPLVFSVVSSVDESLFVLVTLLSWRLVRGTTCLDEDCEQNTERTWNVCETCNI